MTRIDISVSHINSLTVRVFNFDVIASQCYIMIQFY